MVYNLQVKKYDKKRKGEEEGARTMEKKICFLLKM
jgi:hypothetical protein